MKDFKDGYELNPTDEFGMMKMQLACHYFSIVTNIYASIEQTWADYGAGLWWWQIIIHRGKGNSFQIGGNDRQKIIDACCMEEIRAAVIDCINEYPNLYIRKENKI
jgi:hypothetical protein